MSHRRLILVTVWCMLSALGCGGSGEPQRHALHGSVAVKGAAVAKGSISFLPAQGVTGVPASTAIEQGEYRFTKDNGPYSGAHRVIIGIETEPGAAVVPSSINGPTGTPGGIKVAPPPEDNSRSQYQARTPATVAPQTQWELQVNIEDNGDDQKDFDLSG